MADYDLRHLARDLRQQAKDFDDKVYREVEKAALRTKNEWQDNLRDYMSERSHIPHHPPSISYDTHRLPKAIFTAEIGPEKPGHKKQGMWGVIHEFGSVNNNPPNNHGGRALRTETPRFIEAMARIVDIKL